MWTLEQALPVARAVEEFLKTECKAYLALGGSVLTKGVSKDDLDLFIYPHGGVIGEQEILQIIDKLRDKFSWTIEHVLKPWKEEHGDEANPEDSPYETGHQKNYMHAIFAAQLLEGQRIDLFFVSFKSINTNVLLANSML